MTSTKNQTGFYFDESTRFLYSQMGTFERMQDRESIQPPWTYDSIIFFWELITIYHATKI